MHGDITLDTGRDQLNGDLRYGMCRSKDTVWKPVNPDSLMSGPICEVNWRLRS